MYIQYICKYCACTLWYVEVPTYVLALNIQTKIVFDVFLYLVMVIVLSHICRLYCFSVSFMSSLSYPRGLDILLSDVSALLLNSYVHMW